MIRHLPAATVRQSALAKGFVLGDNVDHEMYLFELDGKKTAWWTKLSRGARELRQDEIKNNARALGIAGSDLFGILSCSIDREGTRALFLRLFPETAGEQHAPEGGDASSALRERLASVSAEMAACTDEEKLGELVAEYEQLRKAITDR